MRKGKRVAILLFVLLNLYAILCGGLYFFQENLIFLPSQLPEDYSYQFDTPFQEITHTTEDGASLNGLYFTVDKPVGTVLYFHGNAGDLSRWGEIAQFFVQKNLNVVIMDYRNYGKSTGTMDETFLYQDADSWYHLAQEKATETNTPLYAYGRSLGATFATYIAATHQVEHLLLEAPFYSLESVAKDRFPILPVSRLLKYQFPTYTYINKITAPVTIIHGTADGVVNYDQGKNLFDHFNGIDKKFISVPEGGHNDLVLFPEYQNAISELFKSSRAQ